MRSLQYGTYDSMESLAVRLYSGEIQIHKKGYQEEETLAYNLQQDAEDWSGLLASIPELKAFSRRVAGFGLISSDSTSTGAFFVGIEPSKEKTVTRFSSMLTEGEELQQGDDHVVLIGVNLAKNLQVEIGDSLVALTQGYQNQMGADIYIIKGLVKMGNAEFDRGIIIMPLPNAQELFSLYNGITHVVFSTSDFKEAPIYSDEIAAKLNGDFYEVLDWEKLMPELIQLILIDNVSGAFYLVFIIIVVGFEIFNTTMMSVVERTREFGILQAIGMKPKQLTQLVFLESLIKTTLALAIGFLITFSVISILKNIPIPLSEEFREAYASYGFAIEDIKFSGKVRVYLEPLISIAVIAIFAIIFPLLKTKKLSVVEAFRKT